MEQWRLLGRELTRSEPGLSPSSDPRACSSASRCHFSFLKFICFPLTTFQLSLPLSIPLSAPRDSVPLISVCNCVHFINVTFDGMNQSVGATNLKATWHFIASLCTYAKKKKKRHVSISNQQFCSQMLLLLLLHCRISRPIKKGALVFRVPFKNQMFLQELLLHGGLNAGSRFGP